VLTGSTLRSQPIENKIRIATGLKEQVWPLLDDGTIKPVIHSEFKLDEASKAHQLMESNAHIGKIILIP